MTDKKSLTPTITAVIALVIFGIVCWIFWRSTHQFVTNYFKYLVYVIGFLYAICKEAFKRDEQTKELKLQPWRHWLLPFFVLLSVCIFSGSGDIREAEQKRADAKTQKDNFDKQATDLQNNFDRQDSKLRLEEANHRVEIAQLKQLLAEQRLKVIGLGLQAERNHIAQVELAKRTHVEDTREAERTFHEVEEKANNQQNLITRKSIADVQRSVRSLSVIQHGFQQNARGFQATGEAIKRSVNRIENVQLSYQVLLPIDKPEMATYRAKLVEEIKKFLQASALAGRSDTGIGGMRLEGSSYTAPDKKALSTLRIEILADSPVYPSNFEDSFGNLLSYPIRIKVTRKTLDVEKIAPRLYSDLTLEVQAGIVPKVYYYPQTGALALTFAATNAVINKNTGSLWATPDLDGAKVEVVRDTYDHETNDFYGKSMTKVQKELLLTTLVIDVNNQGFIFYDKDLSHHDDPVLGSMCSFDFELSRGAANFMNRSGPADWY